MHVHATVSHRYHYLWLSPCNNTTAATTTTTKINKYMNTYKYRKYTYRLYLEKNYFYYFFTCNIVIHHIPKHTQIPFQVFFYLVEFNYHNL